MAWRIAREKYTEVADTEPVEARSRLTSAFHVGTGRKRRGNPRRHQRYGPKGLLATQ
jgi:hypothetical protein